MVSARIVRFSFKKGKREEGFETLDHILNQKARNAAGFRGFISFLSKDMENEAIIITLWEDDAALLASEKTLLPLAIKKVLDSLEKEPTAEHFKIFSTEMYMRRPE